MQYLIFLVVFSFLFVPQAFSANKTNLLGVGQGISSPTQTSTVNFTNGFTSENPVGVIYQDKVRATAQGDTGDDASGDALGGEVGIGNGQFGFAVGYYSRDCNNCDANISGALGVSFSGVGVGIRVAEDIMSAGVLINTNGKHRFGLMADLNNPDGDNNNVTSFGAGYSYVEQQITFSLDASKMDMENAGVNDDAILVTPGVSLRFNMVAISLSYDLYVNKGTGSTYDNDLWLGVGFGKADDWHVAIYSDYVNEWSAAVSFFF